jgi:hypothetical protein
VKEPTRQGFGLKLVQRETGYVLGGDAKLAFHADGLTARIEFRLPSEGAGLVP